MTKNASSKDELRLPDELVKQLEPLEAQLGQKSPVALVYAQGYDEGYAGKVRLATQERPGLMAAQGAVVA